MSLVFLSLFNALFFLLGGNVHEVSVWIAYGFIHFAYIMLLITPFLIKKTTNTAILGFSLYTVSSIYFLITFVAGIVFIFLKQESYIASLTVLIIIFGVYLVMLIAHMIANERTADSNKQHESELLYVKDCSYRIKRVMNGLSDRSLEKQLEKAYDLIHSSPVKTNNTAKNDELVIIELIGILEKNVHNNDMTVAKTTVEKIIKHAKERNQLL